MTTIAQPRSRPLSENRPRGSVRMLGPNWYAAVMGTAIVANAGAALPVHFWGLRAAYQVVWALGALLLVVLFVGRGAHWARHADQARKHLLDPAVAPFYGCLSMAMLAVGAGSLSVGSDVIGVSAGVAVDTVLWIAGTAVGVVAASAIPYLMVTRHKVDAGTASPVWILPVVAPMVSAACGPALIAHLPSGQWRETLLLGCYAMFGLSLLATFIMLPVIFARLVHQGPLPLALTPTMFLVLGPLGQSTTAVNNLADAAHGAIDGTYAHAMMPFAVLYGVPVMGFALLWLAIATATVIRAFRNGMKFSMTWWGFTFPIGTCVTGAAGLAKHTGLHFYTWLAVALFIVLVVAWLVAGVRTLRGVLSGALLAVPR
ncbi:TDT family transporter [Streptomyces sp. NPDC050610]|uniref:TDT family transporter n=1 Tax=Streptomyces sp. NPDC050610 TaxID=3157097 RepID=UPI0034491F72